MRRPNSFAYEDEHNDENDERASLLTATSVTARSSHPVGASTSTASHFDLLEDDNDDDWEDISLPTAALNNRIIYWAFWTLPILLYDALRLALFVILLAPAFANFFYYYCTADRQVLRYKESNSRRHVMDVYGAKTGTNHDSRKPVLIFFTGGAWVIGYKMWGAFLAKVFAAMGVLVVIPDYPNYPFVTVPQMVVDAEAAIQWTLDEIEKYGGDSKRVMLAGQSAGGHLASVVLLQKAKQILQTGRCSGFKPKQLVGFCSISSPSDVQAMATNFQKHGLDQVFVQFLFGVRGNRSVRMDDYDPQRLVEQLEHIVGGGGLDSDNTPAFDASRRNDSPTLQEILPPMSIFHGTSDQTVPFEVSERFASSLHQIGITSEYVEYEGWSHTDPILEAIMDSDHRFHADLYDRLHKWTSAESLRNRTSPLPEKLDITIPECRRLCPSPMIRAARYVNPF